MSSIFLEFEEKEGSLLSMLLYYMYIIICLYTYMPIYMTRDGSQATSVGKKGNREK